jgi:hyperosmotically inducible protein
MTSKETTIQATNAATTTLASRVARTKGTATIVTMVAICGVFGCNRTPSDTQRAPGPEERTPAAVEPDNTKKNERDTEPGAVTAQDQGGSPLDLAITQQVRQLVVRDDSLSSAAKNVKIITTEGVVTLRGPVKSSEEKTTLAGFAKNVDGVKRVDNQLEVDADN